MLIGINPKMSPDLLHCLAKMGHGDELVLVDSNYPAVSTARHCVLTDPINLAGMGAAEAAELITEVMPLDGFTNYSALRMQVDDAPDDLNEVHREVFDVLRPRLPEGGALSSIERQDFYAHARTCFAVVHTSEPRGFGCFILRKGVVF